MLCWAVILLFLSPWYHCSADDSRSEVDSLIQTLQQKYCGENSCNATAKDKDYSILQSEIFSYPCPPCLKCSCADDCVVFGDCCPELHMGPSLFSFECLHIPGERAKMQRYVIATDCDLTSEKYSQELAEKCYDGSRDPIAGRLVTALVTSAGIAANVTFRNRFCAECNGVTNYELWRVLVECETPPDQEHSTDFQQFLTWAKQNCWIGFVPPEQFKYGIRECKVLDKDLHSTCNETGAWQDYNQTIEQACYSYYNPLVERNYKNMFCYLCNGQPENILERQAMCTEEPVSWGFKPFSAILNFDTITESEREMKRCKEDEYDDTISNTCRLIICPPLQQFQGDNCKILFDLAHGIVYKLKLVLIPSKTLLLRTINSNTAIRDTIINRIHQDVGLETSQLTVVSYFHTSKVNTETSHDPVLTMKPPEEVAYIEVEAVITQIMTSNISQVSTYLLNLQYDQVEIEYDGKIVIFKSLPSIYFNTKAYNISTWRLNFTGIDLFIDRTHWMDSHHIHLEIPSPYLVCPKVEFQDDEYKRTPNGSLFIIPDSLYVDASNFEFTKWLYIRVCVSSLQERQTSVTNTTSNNRRYTIDSSSSDDTMRILTVVCLGVSLVCLLLCFITHCLFAEMRTLPGINLMFLTAALFIAQALYLFGAGATDDAMVCQIMGILIHYFWLVTFAWMNVCSFHVFRVFKNVFSVMTFNDNKKLVVVRYAMFSYIVPVVIIALNILVNYFVVGENTMGYSDGMNVCFITPGLVSILSFGIPAGLTVAMSTGCFVYTCVVLYKTTKERLAVGKKQSVAVFRFFKLASITGLSWLFGFLGAILKVEVLAYLFIILAGGQGLLVFLSFSFSRTILYKYASCLGYARKKKSQEQSLSQVTSVTQSSDQSAM